MRVLLLLCVLVAGCYEGVAVDFDASETGSGSGSETGSSADTFEPGDSSGTPVPLDLPDPFDPSESSDPPDPADSAELPPPSVSCGDDHPYGWYDGADFPLADQIFTWPMANEKGSSDRSEPNHLISPFGPRWKSDNTYDFHEGLDMVPAGLADVDIDLSNPDHQFPVYPVIKGRVHSIVPCDPCEEGGPGNYVEIRHMKDGSDPSPGNGPEHEIYYTRYLHLHSMEPGLQVGDLVDTDDPIGIMGESGAKGPHLHLEVRSYNYLFYAVNPYRYLDRNTNDYPPPFDITFGLDSGGPECGDEAAPTASRFWVSFSSPRGDEDVVKIEAFVTDRETCESSELRSLHFDCRQGITTWSDTNGDDRIKSEDDLYEIDDRKTSSYPVFEKCGLPGEARNRFHKGVDEYTLDIEFCDAPADEVGPCGQVPPESSMSDDFRIDARICDVSGKCRTQSRMSVDTVECECDSDCVALECSEASGFEEQGCRAYLKTAVPDVCTTQSVEDDPACPAARCVDNTCVMD